jgi:ribose transport system substrate-binding protein
MLALTAACGGGRHDPTEKFFLVATNVKLPYWQTAGTGLSAAARQLGVQAEMVGPDTYDAQAEREAFKKAVAKKPAGILVSVADPAALGPEIDAAISQGIPVVTMDSDAPDSKRLLFIGTNNDAAGMMGGKALVKALGGKGKVIVYTMPGQVNLDQRLHGYKDQLAENHIEIAQVVDTKGDSRVAFDTTNDIIVQGKVKPDGFVCLEAEACKEVADVLDRNKATGKIVIAMDTNQATLDGISKGLITATIAQKPYTMAFYGVKVLDDLFHYKPQSLVMLWAKDTQAPFPMFIDTGATLIDSKTLSGFQAAQAQNSQK